MEVSKEQVLEKIIYRWKDIVNRAYSSDNIDGQEMKERDERQSISDCRPCKIHITDCLSEDFPHLSKKEIGKLIDENIDFENIIQVSGHIRLGKIGVQKYAKLVEDKGIWVAEDILKTVSRSSVFSKTPDEYRRRNEELKERKKKDKQISTDNMIQSEEVGISRPSIQNESGKILSSEKKVLKPVTSEKIDKEGDDIDDDSIDSNLEGELTNNTNIKIEEKQQIIMQPSQKDHLTEKKEKTVKVRSSISQLSKDDDVKIKIQKSPEIPIENKKIEHISEKNLPNNDLKNQNKEDTKKSQDVRFDDDCLYLYNILLKVKTENKGVPLKEDQILEKAMSIDPEFASKFFKRMFRATIFIEMLQLKSTGFMM